MERKHILKDGFPRGVDAPGRIHRIYVDGYGWKDVLRLNRPFHSTKQEQEIHSEISTADMSFAKGKFVEDSETDSYLNVKSADDYSERIEMKSMKEPVHIFFNSDEENDASFGSIAEQIEKFANEDDVCDDSNKESVVASDNDTDGGAKSGKSDVAQSSRMVEHESSEEHSSGSNYITSKKELAEPEEDTSVDDAGGSAKSKRKARAVVRFKDDKTKRRRTPCPIEGCRGLVQNLPRHLRDLHNIENIAEYVEKKTKVPRTFRGLGKISCGICSTVTSRIDLHLIRIHKILRKDPAFEQEIDRAIYEYIRSTTRSW